MKHVHIVPVNSGKDTILESIKQSGYPVQRIYLVLETNNEERIAEELEETLNVLFDVEKVYVSSEIYSSVYEVLKVMKEEEDKGNRVYVNITDSPELLALACLISAQLTGCKLYMARNGAITGIDIPPLKKISEDKLRIVKTLEENNGHIESISKLIDLLEGLIGGGKGYMAQRAKIKYRLNSLESNGLVKLTRVGKQVKVELTELGWAYSLIF